MGIPGVRHPVPGELQKGDWVNVVSRYGPSGGMLKRKRAKVHDVLRMAAILNHMEGETSPRQTRTISFSELEWISPEQQPESAPSRRAWEASKTTATRPPAVSAPPGPGPVLQEPIAPPSLTAKPFEALLSGGKSGRASQDVPLSEVMEKVLKGVAAAKPVPTPSRPKTPSSRPGPVPSKPAQAPQVNGHGADISAWASSGRGMLEKQLADFEERIKLTKEEIEARDLLLHALNEQAENVREMLMFLDKMPTGGRT